MRAVDLFCGAGGASHGLHQAGFKVVLAVDAWKVALETHRLNLPDCETMGADILTLDPSTLPRADFIWGSPPCPDFSVANAKRDPEKGMVLVRKFLDIVEAVKPRRFVMENVPGVLDHIPEDGSRAAILDAADYGVPQHRRRAFVGRYIVPRPTHGPMWQGTLDGQEVRPWVTVRQALGFGGGGVLPFAHRRDWRNEPKVPRSVDEPSYAVDMAGLMLQDGLNPGGKRTVDAPAYTIRADGTQHGVAYRWSPEMKAKHPPATLDTPAPPVMAKWFKGGAEGLLEAPAPTIVGGHREGVGGQRGWATINAMGYRRLTVEECALLQGFPPEFRFAGSKTAQYKQVGNAVPPPMARAIAAATLEAPP